MEIRIVIFLAFVSVTVITDTILIFFAYKAFARAASGVTTALSDLRAAGDAQQFIESMRVAATHAAAITEATKIKVAEFEPALDRFQERHRDVLAAADAKVLEIAEVVNRQAISLRGVVSHKGFL